MDVITLFVGGSSSGEGHGATFDWWGPGAHVTFTITEVRDDRLRIRIAGYAGHDRDKGFDSMAPVEAILPIEPGIALSLRPVVDVKGLPDLHILLLNTNPQAGMSFVVVGPKGEQPAWGALRGI